jgi:hypothetical protein
MYGKPRLEVLTEIENHLLSRNIEISGFKHICASK